MRGDRIHNTIKLSNTPKDNVAPFIMFLVFGINTVSIYI